MHCLGAVTGGGTSSPNGAGGRGGVLSVFRALGVLVCEGRIQGPPRGYKEGPHCAPPMQAVPNDHVCDENNYLCNRYRVLIQEITERLATGSYLCVEVLLCSDCPCGLTKSTCNYPVYPVPSLSISPWQKCASEMLLEYWCICVVPSKSPEPMNFQGLYQAVRSRLHFSQVAAWWSRSNGTEPSYIATRIVSHNEDNLSKFRETSVEHTFPLAGNGDGNSIKVTMWALPRMEEVPILTCSLHPKKEKDEEDIARALTPTKSISMGSSNVQNSDGLVLPVLVDDRLQTTCNKSGKHDCRCEEEDASPLSPTIRTNGERKRRRSLPCGPAESSCVTTQPAPLPSLQEHLLQQMTGNTSSSLTRDSSAEIVNNNRCATRILQNKLENKNEVRTHNYRNTDFERWFKIHLRIEELEDNLEKHYKHTTMQDSETANIKNVDRIEEDYNNSAKNSTNFGKEPSGSADIIPSAKTGGLLHNLSPFAPASWSFVSSWQNSNMNSKFQSFRNAKEVRFSDSERNYKLPTVTSNHTSINPYAQSNPFHESNPGPSTHKWTQKTLDNSACIVHQSYPKNIHKIIAERQVSAGQDALEINKEDGTARNSQKKTGKSDFNQLIWKLSVPDEKEKREEGGLLDWFSKVPGRVLGVATTKGCVDNNKMKHENLKQSEYPSGQQSTNEIKFKNCNLELSQREVDEVLAVLRARTPSGRRRATVKNVRKRGERFERGNDDVVEKITTKCTSSEDGVIQDNLTNRHVRKVRFTSCEDCSRGSCKKINHQVLEEQSSPLDRIYYDKNVYQPAHSKLVESTNGCLNEDSQARIRANEDADHLQNVSTKADVLLGAILRTSKDRKNPSDTSSNGTRLRLTSSIDDDSSDDDVHFSSIEKLEQQDHKITSSNDEKSLPLNKRFHRFRQMFKKEVDKRIAMMDESSSSPETSSSPMLPQRFNVASFRYNNEQPNLHNVRYSKTKRRIDFANSLEATEEKADTTTFSTKVAHQKSRNTHSTNSNDRKCDSEGLNNQQNHCDRRLLGDMKKSVENKEQDENTKDISLLQKNNLTTPIIPQSGHSSSKLRNNNYKDSITETGDDETVDKSVPSALEQEKFRRSLENAASMVFHSRTGLPLTSSPAPLRRGSCCFDYDSSLNSVSSKRNALFELNTPPSPGAVSLEETDRDAEISGEGEETPKRRSSSRHRPQSHALLGSFEESALNGRLEPVSTVHGFTAELGASGSFCPKHQKLPVTVFFYTLGDNDKVSTPYLAHINLEKKGYQVPRSGTIQVTLLNPLGTVVKMFVVLYDLSDMPPRSHTFLRQRTLRDKTLRYLVHLRFMSSKSGRIYLHTDIRMIICRKSDVDTASDLGSEPPKELRSYIHGPTNPKFSPRC